MLRKKVRLNISFAEVEEIDSLRLHNNCFLLRCFPPKERVIFADVGHATHTVTRRLTMPMLDKELGPTGTLFADPRFAGDPGVAPNAKRKNTYARDWMMNPALELDFDSFFTTNPELIKRGIGLQPQAFRDFRFDRRNAGKR